VSAAVVLVTAPDAEVAAHIARTLVEERLAACGNVLPQLRSIYRWEGKVEESAEALLVIKTEAALFERLRARVVELHPYECPEIVMLPIAAGHAPYLAWIAESVGA
jgi:periplasmic divalent cation tolerance protein